MVEARREVDPLYVGYNPHLGYEKDVIQENRGMVHQVANRFRKSVSPGIDYDDLVSVGMMGLLEAFRGYNPDRFDGKVTAFSTYAFPMIRWSIQRFLRDKRNTVRVPRSIQEKAAAIRKQGWEEDSAEKISEKTGWKVSEIREAQKHLNGWSVASLDESIWGEEDDILLLDTIQSHSDLTGIDVQEFLLALDPLERKVIQMRMAGKSQVQIGKQVCKSQAHVSRIMSQIGSKYMQFQDGTLERRAVQMSRVRGNQTGFEGIEWFVDEGVTTNPTIGINGQGIHFNRRAIHDMGAKKGQCVQVGFDPAENRLLIRVGDNGLQLRAVSGDQGGSLRVVNKRLAKWLSQKNLPSKRYALHADRSAGIHFVQLERHA